MADLVLDLSTSSSIYEWIICTLTFSALALELEVSYASQDGTLSSRQNLRIEYGYSFTQPLPRGTSVCTDPVSDMTILREALFRNSENVNQIWTSCRKQLYLKAVWLDPIQGDMYDSRKNGASEECPFLETNGFRVSTMKNMLWNNCMRPYGFICQDTGCLDCGRGCLKRDGLCFHTHCESTTWDSAHGLCRIAGQLLAEVNDTLKDELNRVAFSHCQTVPQRKFWINGPKHRWLCTSQNSSLQPLDKEANWLEGEPGEVGRCAILSMFKFPRHWAFGLQSVRCEEPFRFLCEDHQQQAKYVETKPGKEKENDANAKGSYADISWIWFFLSLISTLMNTDFDNLSDEYRKHVIV